MQSQSGYDILESMLENFCLDNEGSFYKVDTIDEGGHRRFKRAFLLCGQFAKVAMEFNFRYFAIDCGFMQKNNTPGVACMLEMFDSERNIIPICVGIIPVEDKIQYTWFFEQCKLHLPFFSHLNHKKSVIASDRGGGLRQSLRESLEKTRKRACFRHILQNMVKSKFVQSGFLLKNVNIHYNFGDIRDIVLQLQSSRSKTMFDSFMNKICERNPPAAAFLRRIPDHLYADYTLFSKKYPIRTYLFSTSNIAEQEMWRTKRLKLRLGTPYQFFEGIIKLWVNRYFESVQKAEELKANGALVTNYAFKYFQDEMNEASKIHMSTNTTSGDVTYFVESPSKKSGDKVVQLTIAANFLKLLCTCGLLFQMGIVCRHALCNARYIGADIDNFNSSFVKHSFIKQWHATTYCQAYSRKSLVKISTRIIVKKELRPMLPHVSKGRPRTNRFKPFVRVSKRAKSRLHRISRILRQFEHAESTPDPNLPSEFEHWDAISISTDNYSDCADDVLPSESDEDADNVEASDKHADNVEARSGLLKAKRTTKNKRSAQVIGTPPRPKKINDSAVTPDTKKVTIQNSASEEIKPRRKRTAKLPIPLVLSPPPPPPPLPPPPQESQGIISGFLSLFGYK